MPFTDYQILVYKSCPDLLTIFPDALNGNKEQAWLLECWFKAYYPKEMIERDRAAVRYLVNKYGR
jgi:hypothetical protein